jgi:hypothetical protein
MMDSLISPKQPDGFKTESPIRAFTDFQIAGQYAIGKGFRPSMAHLSRYLDAMEAKEGWMLVQIILPDNDAADPTIIFHRKADAIPGVLELTSDMQLLPEEVDLTIRKTVIGLGQLRDDMIDKARAGTERSNGGWPSEAAESLSEAMDQYADRAAGYAAELAALVPVHGAQATMRELYARHGEAVGRAIRMHPALGEPYQPSPPDWTDHGSDLDIPVEFHEEALRFIGEKRGMDTERLVRDFMLYFKECNQPNQVTHKTFAAQLGFILPAANMVELKRLIDEFRVSKKPDLYESFAASIPPMTSAAVAHEAEGPIPTGIYWSGEHANFYDAVTRKGQGQAFMDAWYFRRAEFPSEPNDLGEKSDG